MVSRTSDASPGGPGDNSGEYMRITKIAALGAVLLTHVSVSAEPIVPIGAVVAVPSTSSAIIAVARPSATATGAALPSNTEVWLTPNAEVNTKRIKQGEKFAMSVTRDVVLGDFIVIPRGTRGTGQVSYRTGKGAFGKSAKMEFDIVELELGGRTIPVQGHYRVEGQGNTGATVGAVVAVGVFAAFVTGRSALISPGTDYKAYTVSALPIILAPAPALPALAQAAGPQPAPPPAAPNVVYIKTKP